MNTRVDAQRAAVRRVLAEADLCPEYMLGRAELDRIVERALVDSPTALAGHLDDVEQVGIAGDPYTVQAAAKVIAEVRKVSP